MDVNPAVFAFAWQRQELFLHRTESAPELKDPVVRGCKFTNVYRAADRVSQHLISDVQPQSHGADDAFFRTVLYKIFNEPGTWRWWELRGLDHVWLWDLDTAIEAYNRLRLTTGKSGLRTVFNQAYPGSIDGYVSPLGGGASGIRALQIVDWMLRHGLEHSVWECEHADTVFNMLGQCANMGPFYAMQMTTDLGYSEHAKWNEHEFIVAGPGSRRGIEAATGRSDHEYVIRHVTENWNSYMDANRLPWRNLFGREPSLMDVQNVFCEYSKFYRAKTGGKMPKKYLPSATPMEGLWFPYRWGIQPHVGLSMWQPYTKANRNILRRGEVRSKIAFTHLKKEN